VSLSGRQNEADLIGLTCWHQLEMVGEFLKELRGGRALGKQFFVMQDLSNITQWLPLPSLQIWYCR